MNLNKQNFWRRISQSKIRNSATAESEGGQKFLPPNSLPFCPPERSIWRAKRAVSSVQKRFGFRQTNAPELNFQEFYQRILPRKARKDMSPRLWSTDKDESLILVGRVGLEPTNPYG